MIKSEIRKIFKARRAEINSDELQSLSLDIANNCLDLNIWEEKNYHLFMPIVELKEVNTEHLLHILQGKDKNVVVSKSDFTTYKMTHYLLTDATVFKKNEWNIPEPVDGIVISSDLIDVVFIPLLAFDLKGNRIGYGKGFYDRFLAQCKPETIKVGLSFFEPVDQIFYVHPNDISLNFAITPLKVFSFKK